MITPPVRKSAGRVRSGRGSVPTLKTMLTQQETWVRVINWILTTDYWTDYWPHEIPVHPSPMVPAPAAGVGLGVLAGVQVGCPGRRLAPLARTRRPARRHAPAGARRRWPSVEET